MDLHEAKEQLEAAEPVATEQTPLVDPLAIGVGPFLDTEPPERRWLLQDLLPLGVVGLLAAGGGTGKSFLTLQLAIATATGRPFLGIEVGEPGGALVLAAEDEREELHRRLWRIVEAMKADGDLEEGDLELIKERLFVASRVGEDNRLIHNVDGQIVRTPTGKRIKATVDELPAINLIVLDPVSRFRDGDENDNASATRFVEAVETLRADTGATVLLPHHVSKQGLQAGTEALSMDALRGASALVDGVRWAAAIATLRKDTAPTYGVAPEDAGKYVRLDTVKNNYAAPWEGMWLERGSGGVLASTELVNQKEAGRDQQAEDRYSRIVTETKRLIQQHGPMSARTIRDKYAGKEGVLGAGDRAVHTALNRAVENGELLERKRFDRRGADLHLPPEGEDAEG